jgi:hypothetical protein
MPEGEFLPVGQYRVARASFPGSQSGAEFMPLAGRPGFLYPASEFVVISK